MLKPFKSAVIFALLLSHSSISLAKPNVAEPIAVKEKREDREPEAATGFHAKNSVIANDFMVAAANPYASEAGYNILKQGGSAVDAAIAVQLVLTLVEPQSSGIGGGAFILHWEKKESALTTFDGRETAPKAAKADMFLKEDGQPMRWIDAVIGGRSVGVPGVMHALHRAHQLHGKLPWNALFTDAIKLAENGFIVSPRLERLVGIRMNPGLAKLPVINAYFYPNGEAIKAGDTLKNSKLASVYRSLAKEGIEPFYNGWIADSMVKAVQGAKIAPGNLSKDDLANYRSNEVPAVCGPYRQFKICGMAPPSSGGIAVIQILAQLERFEMNKVAPESAMAAHLFAQSSRLAFADRDRYIADPAFVDVPSHALLEGQYIMRRSKLINTAKDMGKALAGTPISLVAQADNVSYRLPSTSHISIVDARGNAISMTSSVEMGFGSTVMVEGFILNNQLTDFSLRPSVDGKLVANRVEPLKRPRSSMAPMMVFNQDDSLNLVVGSPGGGRIIDYVAQTMIGILDWGLSPQDAINLPRVTNRNGATTLEKNTSAKSLQSELESMGHQVRVRDLNSGVQAIQVQDDKLIGGADPRREGKVMGQ